MWPTAFYLCAIASVLVMAVVILFCREILTAMHTTPENFPYAFDYIYWIFWGIPFVMLYNMTSSMIRAVGDSKSPLLFLAVAAAINVGLDLLFILVFHLGVAGAAWATNLSRAFPACCACSTSEKSCRFSALSPGELAWRRAEVLHLLANGFPMSLQYFITSIGSITLQSAVNGLGTIYVNALRRGARLPRCSSAPLKPWARPWRPTPART